MYRQPARPRLDTDQPQRVDRPPWSLQTRAGQNQPSSSLPFANSVVTHKTGYPPNPIQVHENVKALDVVGKLTPDVLEEIENILANKPLLT
jgi:hypothetical protein